jgi:hypothetical protein
LTPSLFSFVNLAEPHQVTEGRCVDPPFFFLFFLA